jgi:hypothetical protein
MPTPNTTQQIRNRVSTSTLSWQQMVERAWGAEFSAPDHNVYQFGNNRGFDSSDRGTTGIYSPNLGTPSSTPV